MFDPVIDPVQRIRLSPHEHDQNCEDNYDAAALLRYAADYLRGPGLDIRVRDIHIDLYNGVVTLYVEPRHVPD
jgi:hypothetical protein